MRSTEKLACLLLAAGMSVPATGLTQEVDAQASNAAPEAAASELPLPTFSVSGSAGLESSMPEWLLTAFPAPPQGISGLATGALGMPQAELPLPVSSVVLAVRELTLPTLPLPELPVPELAEQELVMSELPLPALPLAKLAVPELSLPKFVAAVSNPPLASRTALARTAAGARSSASAWQPVSEHALDDMRAGFDLGSGLVMSIGIERMVSINGNVVSSTTLNVGDLASLNNNPAQSNSYAATALNVIQNGAGNTVLVGALPQSVAGTVIQNTLNNQVLSSTTVVNSTVNSLGILRGMNFMGTLSNALSKAAVLK